MSNAVISLAIIGKNNEPLYLREFVEQGKVERLPRHRDLFDEGELFGFSTATATATTTTTRSNDENDNDKNDDDNDNQEAESLTPTLRPPKTPEQDDTETSDYDFDDDDDDIAESLIFFKSTPPSLRQEFLLHAALDRFEQIAGPPPGYGWRCRNHASSTTAAEEGDPMYVGLIYPNTDELRVYGYMTTTRIKFFVVVVDDPLSSNSFPSTTTTTTTAAGGGGGGISSAASSYYSDNLSVGSLSYRGAAGGGDHPTVASIASHELTAMSPGGRHSYYHQQHHPYQQHSTDVVLQKLFSALHQCYVSFMLNPFSPLQSSAPIVSKRFDEQIQATVTRHNRLCLHK